VIRPTVRLRLTLWYASIFLLGGAVLLAISYVVVSRSTASFPTRVGEQLKANGGVITVAGGPAATVPPGLPATKILLPAGLPASDRRLVLRLEQARTAAEQKVSGDIHGQIATDFALALAATTLVSLLAGWIVAGRALRPVARITAAARRVAAEGDLGERIALAGPADELRELADTFDAMLERLDRSFASQRSFVANASHELRTPLAIIRAEIEERLDDPSVTKQELRQMAAVVHAAVARSEALITSLLTLARSHTAIRRPDTIDLAQLAHAAAARSEPDAAARGIAITVAGQSARCHGDKELLERLLANLLENATRYNHDGGFVRLEIEHNRQNATLRVSNSGDVVPAEAIPHLFEPFYRIERSRSRDSGGAGLGLSIAAAVAAAHGGTTTAAARETGGLEVTVTLPTQPAPHATEHHLPSTTAARQQPKPDAAL